MRVSCVVLLLCLSAVCYAQKAVDFAGHTRNLTIDSTPTTLDVFAKADDDQDFSVYCLQVRVGEDSDIRIRYLYFTGDDLEFITPENISSVDYDYTFRVRLISLIEFQENDTTVGFDFYPDSPNDPVDIIVREVDFGDLSWDGLDELADSPTDDGARHFSVTGTNLQDGIEVTITFHVSGDSYTVGEGTYNPDAVKIDFVAAYNFLQAETSLALYANIDCDSLDDPEDIEGIDGEKQVVIEDFGYLAWTTSASDGDDESFDVNNTDVHRANPSHPQDSDKNDDHISGEKAYRIVFSFNTDFRNEDDQIVLTWDPEIGNGNENAAVSITVSYALLMVAAFVHVMRRWL